MLDLLRRNASGPFGLTLIILLVLAFSVWGIGDIFRNYDVGTLARIGDREVDSQEFLFRYNREINRISNELERFVSNEEARDSGIDIQILTNLLVEKTLNSSADKMKLRPSDNSLTERLKNTNSFRNAFNQFDKNVFNQVLRQNGITEDLFFSMERDSIAQAQIYRALFENLNISKEFSNLIHRFQNEDRNVEYLVLNTTSENADSYEINNEELLEKEHQIINECYQKVIRSHKIEEIARLKNIPFKKVDSLPRIIWRNICCPGLKSLPI